MMIMSQTGASKVGKKERDEKTKVMVANDEARQRRGRGIERDAQAGSVAVFEGNFSYIPSAGARCPHYRALDRDRFANDQSLVPERLTLLFVFLVRFSFSPIPQTLEHVSEIRQ
jgi:hypothetical protein